MTSKAHKRNRSIDERAEDESEEGSPRSASAAALFATASAHRWKAAAALAVAAVVVAIGTGFLDVGKLASWPQISTPERGEAAATAAAGETADAKSATTAPATSAAIPKRVSKPELKTCFTPHENCVNLIVTEIDAAQSEILIQANSLSAKKLIKALGRAHLRGVKVRVILDKADERRRDRAGPWLIAERILPQVDTGVASAHNKIMIIDRDAVITGSFNFTEAAQKENAENVLLIKGHPDVAGAYAKNWERRLKASRPYYGTMAPVL